MATTGTNAQADCLLQAGIEKTQVLLPASPRFAERQASYYSRGAQSLRPACIVQPRSAQDVSAAVRALVAAGVPFAVRSGGHTAWAGSNGIGGGGVTIDLGQMDWVRVVHNTAAAAATTTDGGAEETVVDIGPGNRWGRVYAELETQGLTVAGGREGNVGVAGLVLGGGLAFFTARYGLACDNVVEFEVVLADGRVVRARGGGEHADLFRALKGGSSNFGIVTNIRMRSLPAPAVWGGMTVHPKEVIPDAIHALKRFTDEIPADVDSNLLCFITYTGALIQIAGVQEAPAYKKWLEMPTTSSTCKPTTIAKLAMDFSQATNYHNIWFTATFKNDIRVVARAVELHEKLVGELKTLVPDGDFITQCLFQPLPRLFGQVAAGGNVLGLERQRENGLLWLAVAQVRTAEQAAFAHDRVRAWVRAVEAFAAAIDGGLEWTYLNYADGVQDPLASYGEENVRLMKEVAGRYDPGRVFQTLCPGGFKISDVKLPTAQGSTRSRI